MVLLGVVGSFGFAHAITVGEIAELEAIPYLKGGTIAWDQLGGIGGHKSIISGGLNTNVKYSPFGIAINLEKWWLAEALDDDRGIIPKEGMSLSTDVQYFLKTKGNISFYPYAGVGFEE
jgi:hypothetical protein